MTSVDMDGGTCIVGVYAEVGSTVEMHSVTAYNFGDRNREFNEGVLLAQANNHITINNCE